MANFRFYPSVTDALLENCGLNADKYQYSYFSNGLEKRLNAEGKSTIKLTDPLELWKLSEDGITIKRKLSIAYPELLYGPDGIACTGSEIGLCIIWINDRLSQTGHILPKTDTTSSNGRELYFEHSFAPGEIDGDLELILSMYIKSPAINVPSGEEHLMNEKGVFLGDADSVLLDFDSIYMEFPIEEVCSQNDPLWWIEFSIWDDPKTVDKFTKDSLCLYLNRHYATCPMTDGEIKNMDMLIDILATSYCMIYERLSDDQKAAVRNNIGLEPNSVCSVLHQTFSRCNKTSLKYDSPESLLKSLQENMRSLLTEEEA